MQALSQSAFLQALGYAIASSLWQAALLWLLVAGVNGLFKIASQAKYRIALMAQFGAFAWFLVTLQFYYNRCSEAIAQMRFSGLNSSNAFVLQNDTHSFSATILSGILKGEKLLPYLSIAYLCLLVLLAVRWIKGYRQTMLIKTQGLQKIDVQWRLFVKRISELLNIKHGVHIYVSGLVKSPLTIGFLKPLILIPVASINNLTTYQLEAVILHELAHIKRADYFINIIQSIIEIALFFNPFTQLLGKIIKRERENSCDDWVLQFQYDPSTYAEALLRIAYMQQTPAFAMNAGGHEKDLLWRVKRMLNQKEKTFQYRNRLFALLLITGLLSSVAWFNPAIKDSGTKQAASTQAVMEEPLAAKVDNPFFNPVFFLNKPFKEEVSKAAQEGLQQAAYAIGQTKTALASVAPIVADKIKTINIGLPAIMSQAGDEVNAELNKINLPVILSQAGDAVNIELKKINLAAEVSNEMKGNKDSSFVINLLNTATDAVKNVDLKKISKEIGAAQKDLSRQLEDKTLFAGVDGIKWKELIKTSMDAAQQSLGQLQLSSGENDDDDDAGSAKVVGSNGSTITNKQQAKGVQLQKIQLKIMQNKKVLDSLRNVVSIRNAMPRLNAIVRSYNTAAGQYEVQQPVTYSYSQPAVNTYIQAKYDQDKPYNLSLGKDNEVSVSSKGNSTLIAVKEDAENADSYKKRITIETLDSTGQKHTFHITVEVYQ